MPYIDFDEIVNYFKDYNEEINIDNYYDIKHNAIEEYLLNNDYENKQLVDQFGVFKALKLYTQNFGEFDFEKNESNMYATLAYIIIDENFNNKFPDYTDIINAIKELETEEDEECDKYNHCDKCLVQNLSALAILS